MSDYPDRATDRAPDPDGSADDPQTAERACPRSRGQLILIPLLVVIVLVAGTLAVGWLVVPEPEPADLIRDLSGDHRGNWRQALVLANLLRNPEHAEVRRDTDLARQLGALLDAEVEAARMDQEQIQLRTFLCRALGEFSTPEALPPLIRAGRTQRGAAGLPVRRAAVEAATVLASRLGPEAVRGDARLLEMALAASETFEDSRSQTRHESALLRGSAAFLLGVLGGEVALERLGILLDDPVPDVRFNAATGLARYGRVEAIVVLQEMLDPDNPEAVAEEVTTEGREWKRSLVLTNAMRAVDELAPQVTAAELTPLIRSLDQLSRADVSPPIQTQARQRMQALTALQSD